jgi:hypothetical protein
VGDVSSLLQELKQPDPVDWDKYEGAGESRYTPPPVPKDSEGKAIVFRGQAPASFTFDKTQEGYLQVVLDPITIVGGAGNGYQIRFTRASVKKFTSRKTGEEINASMLGNYLRAVDKNLRPASNAEYIRAVEYTANRQFNFTADWEAYDSQGGRSVAEKFEDFPLAADGSRQSWIDLPDGRRIFARLRVKQFRASE